MKLLFQAPVLDATWKGFVSNLLLKQIERFNPRVAHISNGYELLHSLGNSQESLIDRTILQVDSSLGTRLNEYEIQLLICDWQQAWNLVLPNAINIVIGLDENENAYRLLGNCLSKVKIQQMSLEGAIIPLPSNSLLNQLDLEKPFRFIYPNSFSQLTKQDIDTWLKDKPTRLIVYYPEPYCNPISLKQVLDISELGDIDVDIISNPLSIDELIYLNSKSINSFVGFYSDSNKVDLLKLLESIN